MPLSATVSTTACILANSSPALVLSPARTAFSTFFTAVRYLERREVFAALILTSWRTRLRPDARRGFFFLGFPDAIVIVPCVCGCCQQSPRLYQHSKDVSRSGYTVVVSLIKSASTVSLWTLA